MQQLVLSAPGAAEWSEVAEPVLTGDQDALVRPIAVATCDLDTAINAGAIPLPLPYELGHEFVAEVVAVAPGLAARPGDVVGVSFQICCGACAACRRGHTGDCQSVHRGAAYGLGAIGGTGWGAAVADLVRVPYADAMLVPIPDGVSPATVASLDNLPDAWRTVVPHLDAADEKRVLVVGGISIGLYAVGIARALGAEVTYVDHNPRRCAAAEALGARVVGRGEKPGKFPITVSTDGSVAGLVTAIDATEPNGVCTDTGVFLGDVPLPLGRMYTRGIRFLTGRAAARPAMGPVLDLVASGALDPALVTATTAAWAQAPQAWSTHRDKLVLVR